MVLSAKRVPFSEVRDNAARWLAKGFGHAGQVRVTEHVCCWRIECEVEGVPAHDPEYVRSVKKQFNGFVSQGWGPLAIGVVAVKVLAGDTQDGTPRAQLIVMPQRIEAEAKAWP